MLILTKKSPVKTVNRFLVPRDACGRTTKVSLGWKMGSLLKNK